MVARRGRVRLAWNDGAMEKSRRGTLMSTIDKQRITAVRKLEQLGYTFAGDDCMHPANDAAAITQTITDELHALLVKRADNLEACTEGSREERELSAIVRAIEAYEAVRWPTGKIHLCPSGHFREGCFITSCKRRSPLRASAQRRL